MAVNVYVGIDVACAKNKSLPICFVTYEAGKLKTLQPPDSFLELIPRGLGNREIENEHPFCAAADQTASVFQSLGERFDWNIVRIAIDAPAAPPRTGKRKSELALNDAGLQCIPTPDNKAWASRIQSSRDHLNNNGPVNRLPGANQIWMLYGFELFKALRKMTSCEVIEVYPYAIMRTLLAKSPHKKTREGYTLQLRAIANATGCIADELESNLKLHVRGSKDDRLDAYMAAWVASLKPQNRHPFGSNSDLNDAIWVPRISI